MTCRVIFLGYVIALLIALSPNEATLLAEDELGRNQALLSQAFAEQVNDGLVDYDALKADEHFNAYLRWLAAADTSQFETRNQAMAFWVNAYNALAIKGVIDYGPLEKVVDAPGFFDEKKHAVAGAKLTLDEIEKGIIYKKFEEPRLHFVLVCAATSCPKLDSSAYSGTDVLERMERATRAFLNNPERNRLDRQKKVLYLSKIFSWYPGDFSRDGKSVIEFVKPYFSEEVREFLTRHSVEVDYLEYDWSLNDQKK